MSKILITTVCIGNKYLTQYEHFFHPSQKNYCQRHGYDFLVLTEGLSPISHADAISFNKALVFSQEFSKKYEWVVFIDADIYITPHAPPIGQELSKFSRIAMVDEYSQPTRIQRFMVQSRLGWEKSASEYYALAGFKLETDHVFNTGVIATRPSVYSRFFKEVYIKHALQSINHPRRFHFEQSAIGYEVQASRQYEFLDAKFNALWCIHKLSDITLTFEKFCNQNYFVHFAGITNFSDLAMLQK
jgi:hypothetical protein